MIQDGQIRLQKGMEKQTHMNTKSSAHVKAIGLFYSGFELLYIFFLKKETTLYPP